ncbi:MAG: hypothetical protein AB8G11_07090 [Saprospiraceae bacterium]
MLNKNLKIWLGISTISILILLFWTNRPMEIIPFLVKNDAYFHQVANEYSEETLEELYKQVEAYPMYQEYFDDSKSADSIIQQSLKNAVVTDLKEQKQYIVDSLLNTFDYYNKNDIEQLLANIYDYSNDELTQKELQGWSLNLIKSTMLQRNKIALLNFYADKMRGSCCFCFTSPEPILISQSINPLKDEKYQFQFGMSRSDMILKNVQLWVNNEAFQTKDGKVHYKKQTTKSGWNDLKIKYQGEYKNRILTDSLTYRYYVCD